MVSDRNTPLSINMESDPDNTHEVELGRSFLNAISRGGLTTPSNLLFITCIHASDLFQYIKKERYLMEKLMSSSNARLLFVEIFLNKLEEMDNSILLAQCEHQHQFSDFVLHIASVMFNLFAKNIEAECNSSIHRERKKMGRSEEKRDTSFVKEKKLKS